MKKRFSIILTLACAMAFSSPAQLRFATAKFHMGDNPEWKALNFDDSSWKSVATDITWQGQNMLKENTCGWYRVKFVLPKSMLENSDNKSVVVFDLNKIDDADEAYLNGKLIGKTGSIPQQGVSYETKFDVHRIYSLPVNDARLNWGGENILAVRAYNGTGDGGMNGGPITISVPSNSDYIEITSSQTDVTRKTGMCTVKLHNQLKVTQKGKLVITTTDPATGSAIGKVSKNVVLKSEGDASMSFKYPSNKLTLVKVSFEPGKGKARTTEFVPKYILTPEAPAAPRINGPDLMGVRPGSPVIFKIPVSGERPMKYSVERLPEGLTVNPDNGAISGKFDKEGVYEVTLVATNAKGTARKKFEFHVGLQIGLTPPMGWNSWNCWGLSVSQEKVISSAKALLDKGLADYGYSYINVDDAWEAPKRNADGTIACNEKFPDMKGLGDFLHSNGLRFGIYSSPGDVTCGQYLGSLDHEKQDAETYNSWGVDYLKYDWCGYFKVFNADRDKTTAAYVRPYLLMEKYLREQPRDIFYSLCQYGMADVWKWGNVVDANSWRTTGDITDTWSSLYQIGFVQQAELYPYAKPGNWNDPDMLIVGKVGWGPQLRDSRLTADEQYTHISLWSLLASNMLIGCDIAQMDEFTCALLCNNEVVAVNQDRLGRQAKREVVDGKIQIWKRPLHDGSYAVGIFNIGLDNDTVDFGAYLSKLGISQLKSVRDLWAQKDLDTANLRYFIPSHGVKFLKIKY